MNLGQRMRAAGHDPSDFNPMDGLIVDQPPARRDWIDRLRGLAIVLMVLDHVLVLFDPVNPLRYTATRFAAPVFLVCMAALYRPGHLNRRRLAWMVAALVVEVATFPILGIPLPGIMFGLLTVTLAAYAWPGLARHGYLLTVAGVVVWVYVPLGPLAPTVGLVAIVFAWWGLGRIAPWQEIRPYGERIPAVFAGIGRHPLGFYVGHLLALAVAVVAATP